MQRGAASPSRGQWFALKPTSINSLVVPIFSSVQPGQSVWSTPASSRGTRPSQRQPQYRGHNGAEPEFLLYVTAPNRNVFSVVKRQRRLGRARRLRCARVGPDELLSSVGRSAVNPNFVSARCFFASRVVSSWYCCLQRRNSFSISSFRLFVQ